VLLEMLKREGLAGATVTRGVAGYGAHSRIHIASIERLSEDLPLIVEVVDRADMIERALAVAGPMVREGLITVEEVQIVKYSHRHLQPLPGDRRVRDFMTADVVSVRPDAPLADVADLLIGRLLKAVPVVEADGRVAGIITDTNLIERGGAQQRLSVASRLGAAAIAAQLADMRREGKTARDVMSAPVVTVRADDSLAHAASRMNEHGVKRLPVLDADDRLCGMLSRVDILRAVATVQPEPDAPPPPPGAALTVGEVMDTRVPAVPLDASLADIVDAMVRARLKRVIVLDAGGRPAGIINDGDLAVRVVPEARPSLLRALMRRAPVKDLPDMSAAELMSPAVLSGPPGTPIAEAVRLMLAQGRKRFVVVDEAGRPVGIVDRRTLLRAASGIAPEQPY
jgi:CBS domain-containing protein